jgi:protein TonB
MEHAYPTPRGVHWDAGMGKPFTMSVVMHGMLAAVMLYSGFSLTKSFGGEKLSTGSVGVNIVQTIPIPRNEAPPNPLANDTKSNVPQEPQPVKLRSQVKAPEPDAIPLRKAPQKKPSPKPESRALFKPTEYKSSQVYSTTPQATSSKMFGMQGSLGIDIGPESVLGSRFGAYVDLMRARIASKWNTADVRATPQQICAVSFTIARDGSVSNVQVTQSSGNYLLDNSAKRAVLDANPLPALPAAFDKNAATVELKFQVSQ